MMMINIGKIIEQGKKEGVFINRNSAIIVGVFIFILISFFMIYSVRGVINPEFIMNNKFSIQMALEETIEIIINGITTDKGKKAFQLLKSEQSNENN